MTHVMIDALLRKPTPYTPIWIMRQAGRYLPSYRAVRERHSFHEMVYTPELAAEVTLQPVHEIGVDAAILFSDILVVPEAMGMELTFEENRGPVFHQPLRSAADVERLRDPKETGKLEPVFAAVQMVQRELGGRVPLIGFAGAPWTLAAYMIEGQGSRHFKEAKALLYREPDLFRRLLERVTHAVIDFLREQVQAGAQILQIFDSWAGYLPPRQFRRVSLPCLQEIVDGLQDTGVPLILFARGAGHSLQQLADTGAAALAIDWQTDFAAARQTVADRAALQGNLDPVALYAPLPVLQKEVDAVLEVYGADPGHVFNLGHGILPDTPVDHVKALVEYVHERSAEYRSAARADQNT